jgi:hypothetical protein
MQLKVSSELKRSLTLWHESDYPIDEQALKREKDEASTNKNATSQGEISASFGGTRLRFPEEFPENY